MDGQPSGRVDVKPTDHRLFFLTSRLTRGVELLGSWWVFTLMDGHLAEGGQ